MSDRLDVEELLGHGRVAAGTDDFGAPGFRVALDRLVDTLNAEAELGPMRVANTTMQIVAALLTRARIAAALRAGPALAPIEAPIVIVGFPRTGTTLLQNLLATHPEHRAHPLWELRAPVTPPDAGPNFRAEQIAQTQAWLDLLLQLAPAFAAIHPMHALRPDECSWLFRHSFATMVYAYQYLVPSYARWLATAPMGWAYAEYADQLRLLGARTAGGRLLLKDPCHLWHLDALLDTFPDALVVQIHRPPSAFVPSLASLCSAMQSFGPVRRDPDQMGAYTLELADQALASLLRVRRERPDARWLDLSYRQLVLDPVGTALDVCRAAGSATADGVRHRLEDWLDLHPPERHGAHAYSLAAFGIDPTALEWRFAAYTERFAALL